MKPDGVERGLIGEIIGRLEAKQLRLVAAELRTLDPVLVTVVEGPADTWQVVRGLMGATNAKEAAPGTIRGDLSVGHRENLVHGSDSAASAQREIEIFFPHLA